MDQDTECYFDFIKGDDAITAFEMDIEAGQFMGWLTLYPNNPRGILAYIVTVGLLDATTLQVFLDQYNLDLDEPLPQLDNRSLLQVACVWRNMDQMKVLVDAGATPTQNVMISLFEGREPSSSSPEHASIVLDMFRYMQRHTPDRPIITLGTFPPHFIDEMHFENDDIIRLLCLSSGR